MLLRFPESNIVFPILFIEHSPSKNPPEASPLFKELQENKMMRAGEIVFPRKGHINDLSRGKWSALNTYIQVHYANRDGYT